MSNHSMSNHSLLSIFSFGDDVICDNQSMRRHKHDKAHILTKLWCLYKTPSIFCCSFCRVANAIRHTPELLNLCFELNVYAAYPSVTCIIFTSEGRLMLNYSRCFDFMLSDRDCDDVSSAQNIQKNIQKVSRAINYAF